PPQAPTSNAIAAPSATNTRMERLLIFSSTLTSAHGRSDQTDAPPPEIGGMVHPLTGLRQVVRISVSASCYRHAPWERNGRSHAPPDEHSTCSCCSSSVASTA